LQNPKEPANISAKASALAPLSDGVSPKRRVQLREAAPERPGGMLSNKACHPHYLSNAALLNVSGKVHRARHLPAHGVTHAFLKKAVRISRARPAAPRPARISDFDPADEPVDEGPAAMVGSLFDLGDIDLPST
jgi:hypothetical protein